MGEVRKYDATVSIREVIAKAIRREPLTEHEIEAFPLNQVLGQSGVAWSCRGKFYNNKGQEVDAEGNLLEEPVTMTLVVDEDPPPTGEAEKGFPCDLCPFVAKSEGGLASHKRKHARELQALEDE